MGQARLRFCERKAGPINPRLGEPRHAQMLRFWEAKATLGAAPHPLGKRERPNPGARRGGNMVSETR